jgi:hypothetical protein
MRTRFVLAVALALLLCAGSAPAQVVVTVDENCNGTIRFGGGSPMPLECARLPDPTVPAGPLVPTFFLTAAPTLVAGDLILIETPALEVVSDLIRFLPNPNRLLFYSDFPEPGEGLDLSDVGLPPNRLPNSHFAGEEGSEGNNGFLYEPLPGQPGFVPVRQPQSWQYRIISDTPEPASVTLLGLGALGLLGYAWRRGRVA